MNETDGTGRDCENGLDLLYWESSREHRIFSSLKGGGRHAEDNDIQRMWARSGRPLNVLL